MSGALVSIVIANDSHYTLLMPSKFIFDGSKGAMVDQNLPFVIAPNCSSNALIPKKGQRDGCICYRAYHSSSLRPRNLSIEWSFDEENRVTAVSACVYQCFDHHPLLIPQQEQNKPADKEDVLALETSPRFLLHKLRCYDAKDVMCTPRLGICSQLSCNVELEEEKSSSTHRHVVRIRHLQKHLEQNNIPNEQKELHIITPTIPVGMCCFEELFMRMPTLKALTLDKLLFLGTHDSGAYKMVRRGKIQHLLGSTFPVWSQCQTMTVLQQLEHGARYLDLRVDMHEGKFHIFHGPVLGPLLDDIFIQINTFMSKVKHEIILLQIRGQWSEEEMPPDTDLAVDAPYDHVLATRLYERLGEHFYVPPATKAQHSNGKRVWMPRWESAANVIKDNRPKMAVFYVNRYFAKHADKKESKWFCPDGWFFGPWINTSSLATKLRGLDAQIAKIPNRHIDDSPARRLYKFQWTLTPQAIDTVRATIRMPGVSKSVRDMAEKCNHELHCFLAGMRTQDLTKLNVITVGMSIPSTCVCRDKCLPCHLIQPPLTIIQHIDFCETLSMSRLFVELNILRWGKALDIK